MVTYHFYCFFRNNAWWRTFRESFKKIYRELFFLSNHLKNIEVSALFIFLDLEDVEMKHVVPLSDIFPLFVSIFTT